MRAEVDKLLEGNGVNVLGFVHGGKKDEVELLEWVLLEDCIFVKDLFIEITVGLKESCLEKQINEIRKGKEPSSSGNDHNLSWLGHFQFKTQTLGLAELERLISRDGFAYLRGEFAIRIHLNHNGKVAPELQRLLVHQILLLFIESLELG